MISPRGFKRVLTFAGGKVTSDASTKVTTAKTGDMWSVDINDYEPYRIPEANRPSDGTRPANAKPEADSASGRGCVKTRR